MESAFNCCLITFVDFSMMLAWVRVLVQRGWAERTEERSVEQRGDFEWSTTITVSPWNPGAVPLVFTAHDSVDPVATLNVEVSAGGRPQVLAEVPGCGCDACDSGSAWLLEDLDEWALSVVDGSLVVDPSAPLTVRTSFGGQGTGGGGTRRSPVQHVIVAGPWSPGWTPMPVHTYTGMPALPELRRGPETVVGGCVARTARQAPQEAHAGARIDDLRNG